ncbi:hypothetical protein [Candidatus Poriferisocius sp.]|uniref:hypothetical protein n=1 Tax=Candidatus Poriferisocius sp. TaxID=3101276 RepID=UPI003B02E33A
MEAITATVIGVVGTALFAMIFMQFQHLRQDMAAGFQAANRDLKAQGHELKALDHLLRGHGERLARIEAKLEIEPPAEAA